MVDFSYEVEPYARSVSVTYRAAFQWWNLILLKNPSITTIVVEHKDRATYFCFQYLETFLQMQGRSIKVVNFAETDPENLIANLNSVIYSICARLYGQRRVKLKAEDIVK